MRTIDWKTLTFRDYRHLLMRRKWLLVVPTLLGTIVAIVIAQITTPVYQTETTLIAEETRSGNVLQGLLNTEILPQERTGLIRQRILSRTLLLKVANKLNLRDYLLKKEGDNIADTGVISTLKKNTFKLMERLRLRTPPRKLNDMRIVRYLRSTFKVGIRNIITITVLHSEPKMARDIANELARSYVDDTKRRRVLDLTRSRDFLDEELEIARQNLQEANKALREATQSGLLEDTSNDNLELLTNMNNTEAALLRIGIQVQEKTAEINALQASMNSVPPAVTQLRTEVADLEAQLKQLRKKYSDSWPAVAKLKQTLDNTGRQLVQVEQEAAKTREAKFAPQLKQLREEQFQLTLNQRDLTRKFAQYQKAYEQFSGAPSSLSLLGRKAQAEEIYSFFQKRRNEAALLTTTERESGNTAQVLDPAILPEKPIKPNKQLIVAAGIVVGLGFGFAVLLMLEYFNHSIHSLEEAAQYFEDVPVLGVVPKLYLSEK